MSISRRYFVLSSIALLASACVPRSSVNSQGSKPLRTATGIWIGNAGHYVAEAKGIFASEGIEVNNNIFQNLSDAIAAFIAGKVDVLWASSSDAVQLGQEAPSVKIFYLSDYSNGGDGIIARNVKTASDLRGKKIAREDLLFVNVLLRAYLQQEGLTEKDVTLLNMPAADAAVAFTAKQVDAAVTYGPWLTKAAQEGGGEIVFSSKGTNLIADVLITREDVIQNRPGDLQSYVRAVNQGVELVQSKDEEALAGVAKAFGITVEETVEQLELIRFFDVAKNKTIVFTPDHPDSLIQNLKLTTQTAYELDVTATLLPTESLYDDSIVRSL